MKDKLAIYLRALKSNIDHVVLALFIVLLMMLVLNYYREQSAPPPENIQDKQIPRVFEPMIPNEDYEKVVSYANKTVNPEKAENFKPLWEYNMFDYKTVRDKDFIQKQYDKEYEKAESLFNKGRFKEAKEIVDKVLLHWPSHIKSRELLKKIDSAMEEGKSL